MNNSIDITINNSRQCTIPVMYNNKEVIYADISNNKKKNIVNMEEVKDNLKSISPIPIKQYNISNESTSESSEKLSILDKRILREKVQTLSKNECKVVFNMIRNDTDKYTENNNGIFINLDNISEKILQQIYNYVNKVTENKINSDPQIVYELSNNESLNQTDSQNNSISNNTKIKLSNYEKSIIKRNNYMEEQKDFKNNNNWFIKKDALGNEISES